MNAGAAVTYFCFIESTILSAPHMEPLAAEDADSAVVEARTLLGQHASGYAAHILLDGQKIASLRRDEDVPLSHTDDAFSGPSVTS